MKAVEFDAEVGSGHTVTLPPDAAASLSPGQPARVILLIPENDEEQAWRRLGLQQFAAGYDEGDAIYDDLRAVPAR